MAESWKTFFMRHYFNFFPAYRRTGGKITYISGDYKEIRVKLPLNRKTRNYVGSIFGGSLYGAVDPMYMIMLIKLLGPDYVVWDKSATIEFKKPGRSTLFATFRISDNEVAAIKQELKYSPSIDRVYTIDLVDKKGVPHARIEKTIFISRGQA